MTLFDIANSTFYGPYGELALVGDSVYGTINYGGSFAGDGGFKVGTNGSGFSSLHDFGATVSDGYFPVSDMSASNNTIFGTARFALGDTFTNVPSNSSPYTNGDTDPQRYFRLTSN